MLLHGRQDAGERLAINYCQRRLLRSTFRFIDNASGAHQRQRDGVQASWRNGGRSQPAAPPTPRAKKNLGSIEQTRGQDVTRGQTTVPSTPYLVRSYALPLQRVRAENPRLCKNLSVQSPQTICRDKTTQQGGTGTG